MHSYLHAAEKCLISGGQNQVAKLWVAFFCCKNVNTINAEVYQTLETANFVCVLCT